MGIVKVVKLPDIRGVTTGKTAVSNKFSDFLCMLGRKPLTHLLGIIGFPNGPIVRYGNFFIPRVGKSSRISAWKGNLASRGPTAYGLIFEDFPALGMKKFPYLKNGPFGKCIFI